jgi:hypothetical protein
MFVFAPSRIQTPYPRTGLQLVENTRHRLCGMEDGHN